MKLHHHNPYASKTAQAPAITAETEPHQGVLRVMAWVDRYPPWQNAGGEWALHGMLAPLVERGHEVTVATLSAPQDGRCHDVDGVQVWHDSEAPRLLDRADVLVSHLLWTNHAVRAAAHGQLPLVYLFHNDFTIGHWKLAPHNVTAVGYNTEWVRASILGKNPTWQGLPDVVVRPPVWSSRLAAVDTPPADRQHVTLVNVNQLKGAELFYQLARSRPQDLFLGVEGAYGQQLRPRPRLDRNVVWQPHTADMAKVYERTRVLLVPSDYESYGMAAVEALAAGAVVIANNTPGLRESLGPAGLFADRSRPFEWHAHLDRLADPGYYAERSAMSLARFAELEARSVAEVDGFELLLRTATNADRRLPSPGMAGHDPFRAKRNRQSVQIGAQAPVVDDAPPAGLLPFLGDPTAADGPVDDDQAVIVGHVPGEFVQLEGGSLDIGGITRAQAQDFADADPSATVRLDGELIAPTEPDTVTPQHQQRAGDDDTGTTSNEPAPEPEPAPSASSAGGDGSQPVAPAEGLHPSALALVADVPPQAAAVARWIREAPDEPTRYDRAAAAEHVENARAGANRKTVTDHVEPVLYS